MLNALAKIHKGGEALAGRLFQDWERARKILLAVSGGPDSVALMLLAADWARARAGALPALEVATVDHALRPASRVEAETAARWAGALGLPHEILVWEDAKPAARLQELAREARYGLLFSHAARIGADVVATGHHADDQAETILFRLLRGSGLSGLAGMAIARERGGFILSRPLLGLAKADLLAVCESKSHPFISDPSNQNPAFARTGLRMLAERLAPEGLDRTALLRLGRRAARAEQALAGRTGEVRAALPARREPGLFHADASSLAREPEEIVLRLLALEIRAAAGGARPLRLDRLEALTDGLLRAIRLETPFAATLGGAALRLSADAVLTIRAEALRRRPPETPPGNECRK
ncbi:tRNA lysidine(34) synthetase TilS [Methylocapsa palsarum]|uniref:tRNA(Ile)-lysidine synthase n=1 Tax=Methylocapsa palsarum TaxID=1612308 RepID=A0A1I3VXJ9_9HYPH|nr:tRNA lysidine(34) synthetase TilS [Methylocapsa palsarum]SFJ99859.1 tRNA(Ile)-lysidine synthase [Methylocapsa palsarum]